MDNEECWKLMKALFMKNSNDLIGLSLTYYNIIIVDIDNIENQVNIWKANWKKGGRPKKNNPGDIKIKTPPFWKTKPKISKDKIIEDNISKDNNISKDIQNETFWNEQINKMQDIIKKTIENNWMIYKAWRYERARIKNIVEWKEFWKVCEKSKMDRKTFVINIINLASKLQYSKPINNWADLYSNYADVYNKALKTKNDILQPKKWVWITTI